MKTSEHQPIAASAQDAASAQANDAPPAQSPSERLKKPHLKLFNCLMKPSLSLTSLPPQSPKEISDEAQSVERPYNSLKVKKNIFFGQVYELFTKCFLYNFRKSATVRKNFGGVRGNLKIQSARQLRTPERAAGEMEPTFGLLTTLLWTQILSIPAVRRLGRPTRPQTMSQEISEV